MLEPEWTELRNRAREALDEIVKVWKVQRSRVAKYGDEQGLEEGFIQPVLRSLGWKLKYQTYLKGREPDYALFLDDTALDSALRYDRTDERFWNTPISLADAKAWHVNLDRPTHTGGKKEYPPEQIEWYLDRSRLNFAILTNGKLWRLIPRQYGPHQRRFQTFLECDLAAILHSWMTAPNVLSGVDEFLEFYLFFGPEGFREVDGRKPLIVRAIEGSSEYRLGIGEGLKERTFEALRLCIEGFLTHPPNALKPKEDLMLCREQSFILLYRLLFIMYAEDRALLPYRLNRAYTTNRSLGRHRDEIAGNLDRIQDRREEEYSRESTGIWDDLTDLFDLIDRGRKAYEVPAYNGGLFDPEGHPFLSEKRLPDWYIARVIDQLGRAPDPNRPKAGLFRVDYHDLAIQHLGSIYEGLLELQPHHATERMIVVSRHVQGRLEEKTLPASQQIPTGYVLTDISYRPGTIYLQTDKGERRASGSYYTGDHIVNYIVEQTLGPLCKAVSDQLQQEIRNVEQKQATAKGSERQQLVETLEKLRSDFDDRMLRLRVLDPAMGSGHFLIRACQYLAEEIATHPYTGEAEGEILAGEGSLTVWKRRVVERCLYGVDLNGLAVELAKLALWLETTSIGRPLSFLDHHLRHGNSLIGAKIAELGELPGQGALLTNTFAGKVEEQLPTLLKPLADIRQQPSETAEQVKVKEKLFRIFDKAREPFRLVADLWCSTFAEEIENLFSTEQYQSALNVLTNPNLFRKLAGEPWFQQASGLARRPDMTCFHWELEFPEAFFEGTGRLANSGFNAIIGNPPYDVLSELETGRDLSAFRSFIEHEPTYDPSLEGKNNLYKLFICRALELLAEGGHCGFITPMTLLGDKITAGVRRRMIDVGRFTGIEAFPQKDDPTKRVFAEAKLSTAIFTLDKTVDGSERSFVCRVHAGNQIDPKSPSLMLTTSSIPLYDPLNLTIVSCSQTDWDLAVRILKSGRAIRLREIAEFFQGEVNETNERSKGNLVTGFKRGKLVTRGASVCLYAVREASQGADLWLNVGKFLYDKSPDSKAFHHKHARIGLQESSPQNNFRRIIAAFIPEGEFCNHTINYCPAHKCSVDLLLVLALLNTKLADWYFRLGSTNAHVSHYQLYNLPFPYFAGIVEEAHRKVQERAIGALEDGELERVFNELRPLLVEPPFSPAVGAVIIESVNRIIALENERGDIARVERSALNPAAQPYQDLIDKVFLQWLG